MASMSQRIVEKFDFPNPVSPKILDYASRNSKSVCLDIFVRFETHIKSRYLFSTAHIGRLKESPDFLQFAVIQNLGENSESRRKKKLELVYNQRQAI